jgi:hypothetical protein
VIIRLFQADDDEEDKMKVKGWLTTLSVYILIASAIVLLTYFLGHVLLQMPTGFVLILAGLALLAFTIGMAGTLLAVYMKRRRQ